MKRLKGMLKLRKKKTAEPELLRPSSDPAVELPLSACASSLASDGAYVVRRKELGQLHRAAVDGNMGDLLRLVYKHDINEPDKDSRTPLHLACANGYTDIVTFLVDHKCHLNLCDNEGRTPLMKAVQCQQEFCAIYLLEHGADSNILDIHNNTALHFAASNSSLSITKHLLEHKADIEAQNEDGSTPLIVAVIENNREMVEFLLEKGASVHATDNLGRTPLLTAAADKKRDLTNILLRHGSDVFHRDGSGWSAKEYGLNSGDAILLQYIAEYSSLKNREEDSPDDQKVLSVLSCPETAGDAGIMLGAPATNKEVTDDHSFGDSVRDSGKTDNDSWLSSEDEELDFSPKKPQKPSLAQIINISQQFKKTIYEKSSVIRPEHTAISQQNKSNYEAEDLNESFPTPLLQVQSLPRPVQSSPDSFSKCPQMTSNLDSKQGESSEEDDEQEDDDEEENRKISDVVDKNLIYNESSEKPSQDGGVKRAALTSGMNGGEEENVAESPWDSEPKFDKANLEHDANLHLLKGMETREKQKSDLMEELGLDGADDIEDASDWDSASISLKIVPSAKPLNLLMGEGASPLQLATRDDATKTPVTVRAEFSDVRIISASEDQQCNKQKGIKEFERDQKQDKSVIDIPNSIEKPSPENQTDMAEISYSCDDKKTEAVVHNEESNDKDAHFNSTLWEERYEKMWVANEKREVKTNFKSVTAELKQIFGETNVNEKICNTAVERRSQDGFCGVLEGIKELPSPHLSKATVGVQGKGDIGESVPVITEMEFSIENSILYSQNSISQKLLFKLSENGNQNIEHRWNTVDEVLSNNAGSTNICEERSDNIFEHLETYEGVKTSAPIKCPNHSPLHSSKDIVSDATFKTAHLKQLIMTDNTNIHFDVAKNTSHDTLHHFKNGVSRGKNTDTEIGNEVRNSEQAFHQTSKKELDEELKRDVARFKNEVGMLQKVFLTLENEKAQLQKEVEEEKRKQKWEEVEAAGKKETANIEKKLTVNIVQKMEQNPLENEKQHIKIDGEIAEESQVMDIISSADRKRLIPVSFKEKNLIAKVKDVGKSENKSWLSTQRTSQEITENLHQLQDDSSLSEASMKEERHSARAVSEKNKIYRAMRIINDFDDLTQSSDTATEDIEFPTLVYKDAMMLIEQLSLDSKDSVSLLKIQNIFHEYESLIEHERGHSIHLQEKVKKNENEKKEQQRILEDMREMKSTLDHQKVERESIISSLKFSLKQEEEKKMGAERLYEESQEQLRQKEQQYCKQMEEKQQLELMLRNLEMELRTLKNHLKQIEEERNEAQRQLSQEQNARALQESILNTQLWRQKELTELKKTATIQPEMTDNHDQEKELLNKNQILQDEIDVLRLELDRIRARHQEEEARYLEENEALKEKTEELRKELKLNEEALTQTVFQYNAQINVSKTEIAILTSKLEHLKENKERLEIELDSFRSRLSSAVQELERCQISKNELERTLQRECDDWVRLKDKLNHDLCHLRETNNGMSQQLSKAESKANSLENELHRVTHSLREKSLQLESIQRDLSQAQCQVKELENTRQGDKDQMNKYIVKQETMQERLAQLQSENLLLRQQFEDFQNKGIIKEKVVSDVQDRFNDIFSKLRADTEKQVQMKEEINKELITKCNHLKEQVIKYEAEKVDRESSVRHLQQELADSFKKQSMSEASLEVSTRYRIDLEEDKQQLQKELDRIKSKLQESEDQYLQSERRIHDLRNALDAKEHEANVASQKLQDLLVASSGTSNAIKQLEDHIQRLEIENARLEATTTQQASRIEILQKDLQNSASVHSRLEELINGLQIAKINLEEQLNHQVQKQAICSVNAQGTHNMWEEELKSKSKLGVRLSELDREKTEVMAQLEHEKKKVKKLVELKRLVEIRLEEEMKRNRELQKECSGVRKLLKTTKKKLKEYESGDSSSQTSFHGATKNRYSESDTEIEKLRTKVEIESTRCAQLESTNHELREQLSSMKLLEKTKTQLEEDISNLKCHVQGSVIDLNQMEQYKRDVEERARQEIRQKLEEVNVFLQTQAASQETMEQIRANNYASLRNQLENRIKDLESELAKLRNRQQDNVLQKESVRSELERYKGLYSEELKMRKSFGSKLDRANEKLAEASTKLLHERHRSKSLLANSFISGSLSSSPVLETVQLGNLSSNLALNRPLSLGGAFMNPTGSVVSSKTRVEAYLAKMRTELEKNISKELEQATVELDAGSVRVSPIGSIDESSKQDQVSKATQEYLDVLKKNYMI
ncbi:ankyrin repeat domain-containing protein 26 isoform X2 [Rhineura floridana]|uniref:ankyrin repeat domain-containing protein 26 isoform X2 n=1 Tax=Rhineura floridana TaxID=261503 RepID=UPI002AC7ED40|nr:ankyrin repeat domain-containing protein 26 isoform X2 [Rhineura floridana]